MNRAQRRATARNSGKNRLASIDARALSGAVASFNLPAKQFQLTMAKCDATLANEDDADELTISPFSNVDRLSTGTLNDDGFINLNEANVAAFCIAARIHQLAANQETKDLIGQAQPYFEAAADALASIGHRKLERGRYVCKGEELNAIRESIRLYREVIMVSEKGLIMKALIDAKKMVDDKLQKVWRENERRAA